MNIIAHIIILTVFVYVLLIIDLPKSSNNIIIKMYLFGGIMLFELIIGILISLVNQMKITFREFARQAMLISAVIVVAYSVYSDLLLNNSPLTSNDAYVRALIISVIAMLLITLVYIIDMGFASLTPNLASSENFEDID